MGIEVRKESRMNFSAWIKSILKPNEEQFREFTLEDVSAALDNSVIRRLWLDAISERIQGINFEIDGILSNPDRDRIWETFAIERRTLLACLRLVMESRERLERERADEEREKELQAMRSQKAPAYDGGITLKPFRKGEQS
jgi:hypothetical protein